MLLNMNDSKERRKENNNHLTCWMLLKMGTRKYEHQKVNKRWTTIKYAHKTQKYMFSAASNDSEEVEEAEDSQRRWKETTNSNQINFYTKKTKSDARRSFLTCKLANKCSKWGKRGRFRLPALAVGVRDELSEWVICEWDCNGSLMFTG